MGTTQYGQCCHVEALDREATFCPECGTPLLRCRAFDECRLLLYRGDHCPEHVAPAVSIAPGAETSVKRGGRVFLPLRVANDSNCGSSLRVERLYKRTPGKGVEEIDYDWKRLPAGGVKSLRVDSGVLEHAGTMGVDLFLVVSASVGSYRETYAFTAHAPITVGETESKNIHVEVGGDHDGDVVIMGQHKSREWGNAKPQPALPLETVRAEKFEERKDLRGYDDGTRVPRTTTVECRGFSEKDGMPECRPFLSKERLVLGRNSPGFVPKDGGPVTDISLRTYRADGSVNKETSGLVSGAHLVLYLENDRLWLNPSGGRHGTVLNGERVEGATLVRHGDRIRVPANDASGPQFEARFVTRDDMVDKIVLSRVTGSNW